MKIIAIDRSNGLAVVMIDGNFCLFRPPYSEHIVATQYDLNLAIYRNYFTLCDHDFDTLEEVSIFLGLIYTEALRSRGVKLPTYEELRESLEYLADDTLLGVLDRVENELIPQGKYEAAHKIARGIMGATSSPEVRVAAIRVLGILNQERGAQKTMRTFSKGDIHQLEGEIELERRRLENLEVLLKEESEGEVT